MTRTRTDEKLHTRTFSSPIGSLTSFASDRGLRAIVWGDDEPDSCVGVRGRVLEPGGRSEVLDETQRQLDEYFAGVLRNFDVPLDVVGSPFQRSAWNVLSSIPYGETISYGDQARKLGDARKARAVGGANGRNPVPIVVPCHRVIGSNGSLTGFAIGTDVKRFLLDLEKSQMSDRGLRT